MPLPINSSLALLPASRPGDALHTKPKQAMLVRMSTQTLDALDAFPTVQFEFGDNPAIYIGDAYFPMQHSQESTIHHELYLRTSSATKKTAPLKLYANVVGKFAVERELADDLRDKIRESTQDAANQRNNRTTVLLDTPPDLSTTTSRKRKDPPPSSNMFRKPLRPADKPKPVPVASTSAPPAKPPVPSTSAQRDRDGLAPLRKRMIQCLAVSERTEEQVIRLVAGSDPTVAARRDVQDVLEQIAEPLNKPSSDKSPRTYRLRPASWTEARPYEWTGLSESERTSIARSARLALQTLNIPESDPVWSHVRYRSTGSSNPSTSADQTKSSAVEDRLKKQDVAPKRGVSSRDTKEKKPKPKPDPKAEIMMKDESKPIQSRPDPAPRPNPPDRRTLESTRTTASDSKRGDLPQNRRTNDYSETPPARRATEIKSSKSSSRREEPSPSVSANKQQRQTEKPAAPSVSAPKIAEEKSLSSQRIKKIRREANGGGASDSEKERSYAVNDKPKAKDKVIKKEPVDSPRDELRGSASKRKAAADGDDDFRDSKARALAQKRRKTEPVQPPSQRERDEKPKDVNPKKAVNEPRPSVKPAPRASTSASSSKPKGRHDSPSPPVKRSSSNTTHTRYSPDSPMSSNLNPSNHSHKSGSAKPRRRSPIYTSSDEEDEEPLNARPPPKSKPPAPPANNSHTSRDREASSRNLPTDHAALRARYSTSYLEYLTSFQRLVRQKGKLDNMLKNNDLGSTGSITDSEGDTELMDPEELAQLTSSHKKLREELESIQLAFGRTTKSNEPMPAPEMLTV